jgi:uncharacterized protein
LLSEVFVFIFLTNSSGNLNFWAMKLRLGEIEEGPKKILFKETPQTLDLNWKDGHFRSSIQFELEAWRRGDRFLLQGEITTQIDTQCSRCLKEVVLSLRVPFKLIIKLSPQGGIADNLEEDFLLLSPRAETLEIGERVRQLILLALPLKPLCRLDCRGLCPVCGKDLNEGECNCRREASDSRWEKLKSLRGDLKGLGESDLK